ncbi:MAG: tRNA 2-thiouridine(34) synthase MnmA [Candidatus Campbellbacteria bacterium]|nr:tRNA 2-thiouridine(34) synthase MnmA [Candidatus Campbellbacteria bacterium]
MTEAKAKETVFVGLSGGVDSAVSAHLLCEKGYDVVCVFIRGWQPDGLLCPWQEDRSEALKVAAFLKIPFVSLDCSEEYKKKVVDNFLEQYKRGETPNPDVLCNKFIKFGFFLEHALKEGADKIATGHYARTISKESVLLARPTDEKKDQTYFLWTLNQKILEKTIFPLGKYRKEEVRKIANKIGLPNADRKDSQGICFLGDIQMREFLEKYIEKKSGDVVDEKGNTIGSHSGSFFYSLGQRHGFDIKNKSPKTEPYFVVEKDFSNNKIVVSNDKFALVRNGATVFLRNVNWISETLPKNKNVFVRSRHRGLLVNAVLQEVAATTAQAVDKSASTLYTAGQSLVIYDDKKEVVLGGGEIDKTLVGEI